MLIILYVVRLLVGDLMRTNVTEFTRSQLLSSVLVHHIVILNN